MFLILNIHSLLGFIILVQSEFCYYTYVHDTSRILTKLIWSPLTYIVHCFTHLSHFTALNWRLRPCYTYEQYAMMITIIWAKVGWSVSWLKLKMTGLMKHRFSCNIFDLQRKFIVGGNFSEWCFFHHYSTSRVKIWWIYVDAHSVALYEQPWRWNIW